MRVGKRVDSLALAAVGRESCNDSYISAITLITALVFLFFRLNIDAYAGITPVEGSGIFKLNGKDEYVLMYDLYTNGRYEYQTSTDLYEFTKEPKSFSKNFFPRHGTVCSVTAEELQRLQQKWGYVLPNED